MRFGHFFLGLYLGFGDRVRPIRLTSKFYFYNNLQQLLLNINMRIFNIDIVRMGPRGPCTQLAWSELCVTKYTWKYRE